jgi:uncharacterized protein (TIGR02271 family)
VRGDSAARPALTQHFYERIITTSTDDIRQLIGCAAVDQEGSKLGKIGHVYLDDRTGQPMWVTVATGMFGTKQSYAGHLGGETAQGAGDSRRADRPETSAQEPRAQETSAQSRGTAGSTGDDAMTRSEERLRVGTEGVEAGRARLRKYVVTGNVTTQVPVSHEEVRVEREPVTEADRDTAMAGPDIAEAEHHVTLHAERPVVEKEADGGEGDALIQRKDRHHGTHHERRAAASWPGTLNRGTGQVAV